MNDKDPRKRCFHCVFTNCPGTNGALGSITPELLASLFDVSESKRKKTKRHHHKKHKRARLQKDSLSSIPQEEKALEPYVEEDNIMIKEPIEQEPWAQEEQTK
jgi:hypothetical protein